MITPGATKGMKMHTQMRRRSPMFLAEPEP